MTRFSTLAFALTSACLTLAAFGCSDDESSANTSNSGGSATGGGGSGGTGNSGGNPATGGGGSASGGGGMGGSVPQNQYLYVANRSDNTVLAYVIEDDGALTLVETETVTGGPGPLAVTPDASRLYVAAVGGRAISAFDIDPATGALEAAGDTVSVAARPVYIAVDQTAGYLLLASYGDNKAQSFAITADGSIDGNPISDNDGPGANAHSIVMSPGNDFAFVANTNPTPETISQFVFDDTTGSLTPNSPATIDVSGAEMVGPRHLTFHPSLDVFYAVNEHSDSVTVYAFDAVTGLLTEGDTTSTLPGGMSSGSNTCADIHITPDGTALYASNRGDDSIAMFSVDGTGAITAMGHVDTEARPREFEVTRDGRFVYVAGQDSDMLAAYQVGAAGMLTPLDPPTYTVGDEPMWVLAVTVDAR